MPKKSDNSQVATKRDVLLLKGDIQAVKVEINTFKEGVDEKLDRIVNTLDGFVGTVDNLRIENVVGADQIKDLREKFSNHGKRITKLESSHQTT